MKLSWKNPIIWFGLLAIIIITAILLNKGDQDKNFQKSSDDQLSTCQKVASTYVDLTEAQAGTRADKENRAYRVVKRDGVGLTATDDYGPGRLNFEIKNGVVEKATCG